jgi:hypothetical protein
MKLIKLTVQTKCDDGCCKNPAAYAVEREDTPLAFRLNLCEECLRKLCKLYQEREKIKTIG